MAVVDAIHSPTATSLTLDQVDDSIWGAAEAINAYCTHRGAAAAADDPLAAANIALAVEAVLDALERLDPAGAPPRLVELPFDF